MGLFISEDEKKKKKKNGNESRAKGVRENKIAKLGDKTKRRRKQNQKLCSGSVTTSEFSGTGFVVSNTIERHQIRRKERCQSALSIVKCQLINRAGRDAQI